MLMTLPGRCTCLLGGDSAMVQRFNVKIEIILKTTLMCYKPQSTYVCRLIFRNITFLVRKGKYNCIK